MVSENKDSFDENDLFQALKETLERRNVLNPLRAILRAQSLQSLEMAFQAVVCPDKEKEEDDLSIEFKIADELFIDYLMFRRLDQTLSVFRAETSKRGPCSFPSNETVEVELGLGDAPCKKCSRQHEKGTHKVPLIYRVIEKIRNTETNPCT